MTIQTTVRKARFIGDGVNTTFPFAFKAFATSDLILTQTSVAGVDSLVLSLFAISLNSDQEASPGGVITYPTSGTPLPAGVVLTVTSNQANTQLTDLTNAGGFFAKTISDRFDYLTILIQQIAATVAGALVVSVSDPAPLLSMGSAIQRALKYVTFDGAGNVALATSLPSATLSASSIGSFLYPQTAAEASASVTPILLQYPPGDVRRYGILPNLTGSAAANTTALVALLNPSVTGIKGLLSFPNTTGADIYYFGSAAPIQIRDGNVLELNGSTLNFSGSFNAALNTFGFLTMIRDVTVQNGNIVVNYNGTTGVNNGAAIRFGSRNGYGFGTFTTGIYDQDNLVAGGLPLMGNITLRNLRITSNNVATHIIYGFGGIRNMVMENVWIDGQSVVPFNGLYYEYGWSSTNGAPGTTSSWSSSHMTNSHFRNITITNLATGGTSQGFGFNGAYNCTLENMYVNGADQGFGFGTGEAMFFRVWALDAVSPSRQLTMRNLTTLNIRTVCLALGGSNPVGGGYLSAVIGALSIPARYQAQTDLLSFSLDGFSLATNPATGTCIIAQGTNVSVRNGMAVGGTVSFGAEAMNCVLENVSVLNSGGPNGVRFGVTPIWSPTRPQMFAIRNCKIAGSTGVGISVGACQSGIIENNQIGYNTTNDVTAEATQTNGVNLALTSFGVKCRGNAITTASGASAYQSANNNVDNMNSIENERILQTTGGGGIWDTDFQSSAAQVIATAGTITSANIKNIRLAPAAAVTGVIMQAGQKSGQQAVLFNESAAVNTITFAVAGTSRVADGVSTVIAGLKQKTLIWNSGTSLWYSQ